MSTESDNPLHGDAEAARIRITYNDDITRNFVWASVVLGHRRDARGRHHRPPARRPPRERGPLLTFGRLRPLHTNAVIFAFVGNMLFAGIYYSTQRL
jgi:cytochrome c oxidase cbb3-type subunit I/II